MARRSEQDARRELETSSGKISPGDVETILQNESRVEDKVRRNGPLREYLASVKTMFALIRAYWRGDYRQLPWTRVAAIVAALLYVLSPLDLIPDFLTAAGLLDDALILSICLKMIRGDLVQFRRWQKTHSNTAAGPHKPAAQTAPNRKL